MAQPALAETLWDNGRPNGVNGYSNATAGVFGFRRTLLDDFDLAQDAVLQDLHWRSVWGTPMGGATGVGAEISIRSDLAGTPGGTIAVADLTAYSEAYTGKVLFEREEVQHWATFSDIALPAGRYWFEAVVQGPENNFWLTANQQLNECWVNYEDLGGFQTGTVQFGAPSDINFVLTGFFGVADEARTALVVRVEQTQTDTTQNLPASDMVVARGTRFFLELWATDTGCERSGLVGVYVDLAFVPEAVQAISIDHRPPFNLLEEGDIDNVIGVISGLGGSDQNFDCTGVDPDWVRIAVVEFEALCDVSTPEFILSQSPNEIAACGIGAIPTSAIDFGSTSTEIIRLCPYDLDGSGFIAGGDLGLFAGCWLQSEGDPDYDPACDFDCSGTVAAGDLGWFAASWLHDCKDITDDDLPPCRCGTPPLAATPGNVEIGWRAAGRDASDGTTLVELFVRDTDPRSLGLSAVYVDVRLDAGQIESASRCGPFSLLESGHLAKHRVDRLGGATLDLGVAAGAWTPFARLRVRGVGADGPDGLVIRPAVDGIGAVARGTVEHNRVTVVRLMSP